jgi:hypothetical protein
MIEIPKIFLKKDIFVALDKSLRRGPVIISAIF